MASVRVLRTETANAPPAAGSLGPGEFSVEMNDPVRLWVGVPTTLDVTGRKLVTDRSAIIPEPSTAGNFLRTNAGTWVSGLPLSGGAIVGTMPRPFSVSGSVLGGGG